ENNYVHDNSGGLAHTIQTYPGPSGQSAASIIRNNYLYNNPKWGVYLQQYITNVVVEDNVLYDCAYAGSLGAIFGTLNNGSAGTVNSNIWIRGNKVGSDQQSNGQIVRVDLVDNNMTGVFVWDNISFLTNQALVNGRTIGGIQISVSTGS